MEAILTTLILITIISATVYAGVSIRKFNKMFGKNVDVKNDAIFNVQIEKLINKLKDDIGAEKVFLCRFHNGGKYLNGFSMKKFTMTNESYGDREIRCQWRDKLIAHYADTIMQTLVVGDCCIPTIEDCNDKYFKKDMMVGNDYNSVYLYTLKQIMGVEEGFIGVCFSEEKGLTEKGRDIIKCNLPYFVKLINMKSYL